MATRHRKNASSTRPNSKNTASAKGHRSTSAAPAELSTDSLLLLAALLEPPRREGVRYGKPFPWKLGSDGRKLSPDAPPEVAYAHKAINARYRSEHERSYSYVPVAEQVLHLTAVNAFWDLILSAHAALVESGTSADVSKALVELATRAYLAGMTAREDVARETVGKEILTSCSSWSHGESEFPAPLRSESEEDHPADRFTFFSSQVDSDLSLASLGEYCGDPELDHERLDSPWFDLTRSAMYWRLREAFIESAAKGHNTAFLDAVCRAYNAGRLSPDRLSPVSGAERKERKLAQALQH